MGRFAELVTRKESDESAETVSDEGIDDADSDSGGDGSRDYLVSSVSKADLDLISQFIAHHVFSSFFIDLVEKHYDNDDESLLLSVFIANGVEQLKSILTTANATAVDEKTK